MTIIAILGGSLFGLAKGVLGFTIVGISGIIVIIIGLFAYAILMGITGAIGGAIATKD